VVHAREERLERLPVCRFAVSASAPVLRPWKAPCAAMMPGRPVRRASLIAASIDSVPEFVKKTRDPSEARRLQERLGELDLGAGGEEVGDVDDLANLLGDGGDELGWLWPSALTAMPASRSR
jgi:hypothetical protein